MNRFPSHWLLLVALLLPIACKREAPTAAPMATRTPAAQSAAPPAPPLAPEGLPAAWPAGDAVTIALVPEAGAVSLTKALYEHGDLVLEQVWPDGGRERWWHAPDGTTRHLDRAGNERIEAAP